MTAPVRHGCRCCDGLGPRRTWGDGQAYHLTTTVLVVGDAIAGNARSGGVRVGVCRTGAAGHARASGHGLGVVPRPTHDARSARIGVCISPACTAVGAHAIRGGCRHLLALASDAQWGQRQTQAVRSKCGRYVLVLGACTRSHVGAKGVLCEPRNNLNKW